MKSILLYVSDDGSMEARLQAALDLTRAFAAHLTCLQAVPIEVLVSGDRAPLLVVPAGQHSFSYSGPAVVAWDGSVEAAHALQSSLPLLARAASVRIVTVVDSELELPATAAAEYLSRHGIGSELCEWQKGGWRIGAVLLEGTKALGAYLVAGAYGHSRFREAVFGGVTRELIHGASLPLLLAH